MKIYQPAARNDTMLGVCQSLGEDFGFHPNILRVAFGVGLIVAPVAVIAAYAAMAVIVALNHWIFPRPWPVEADAGPVAETAAADREAEMVEERRFAKAA
jgi:phage shock protein PspC (stress-responsive transcriptional regulator)